MSNTTPAGTQISTVEELRHLQKNVDQLEALMRQHGQQLKAKGMGLPQNFLADVQRMRTDIEAIANNLEDAQTELQRLRALSDLPELINSTLDLQDVLNAVIDTVIRLTGAERGYLVLRDEHSEEMQFAVARNFEQRSLAEDEIIISRSIVGQVARTGMPMFTTNAAQDTRVNTNESIISYALRSILCVPLILKGTVTGVIYADNRIRAGLFGAKELALLYAFANQAAIAIENARLFERVRTSLAEVTAIKDLMDNVLASIASGVITTDGNDAIMILNDAACRILNVGLDLSLGRILWDVLPRVDEEFNQLLNLVREREIEHIIEIEPEIFERGMVNLNLKFSPLRDAQRKATQGVTIVVDDLTELKRREEQLSVVKRYLPPALVDTIISINDLGLGGERHTITTMFVDVRSFGTFPPSLRPQELMTLLNSYLTIASDEVTQQNGVIDKYMANEMMALFNTQLNPVEDHAWRAVQAALNMGTALMKLYRAAGERTAHFRVGIHTGVATLGNAGSLSRKEFTAIGDSINLTHRLLENAKPGQIIISDETYKQCQRQLQDPKAAITVIGLDEILVKGKKQATLIYQVTREGLPS
ncbi:MAG TPA: adenylate/guanylate cyclase domain-containing protein [Aggregatilineales bacterium]|nr:adenylate/guanylate cyclase domain-containing protein [Aggregatilineales bacterium]